MYIDEGDAPPVADDLVDPELVVVIPIPEPVVEKCASCRGLTEKGYSMCPKCVNLWAKKLLGQDLERKYQLQELEVKVATMVNQVISSLDSISHNVIRPFTTLNNRIEAQIDKNNRNLDAFNRRIEELINIENKSLMITQTIEIEVCTEKKILQKAVDDRVEAIWIFLKAPYQTAVRFECNRVSRSLEKTGFSYHVENGQDLQFISYSQIASIRTFSEDWSGEHETSYLMGLLNYNYDNWQRFNYSGYLPYTVKDRLNNRSSWDRRD